MDKKVLLILLKKKILRIEWWNSCLYEVTRPRRRSRTKMWECERWWRV